MGRNACQTTGMMCRVLDRSVEKRQDKTGSGHP